MPSEKSSVRMCSLSRRWGSQWRTVCSKVSGEAWHLGDGVGVSISRNNTLRQGRPMCLTHLVHITSIANQDARSI